MKLLRIFESKPKRIIRLARVAVNQDNWEEVLRITSEARPLFRHGKGGHNPVLLEIRVWYMRATCEVWKRADVDPTINPKQDVIDSLVSTILRSEIEQFEASPQCVFFLGLATNRDGQIEDLPNSTLVLLLDLPWRLRPFSKARICGDAGVRDMDTNEGGTKFTVRILGWMDENTVKIEFASFTFPLMGHGYMAIVRRTEYGWHIEDKVSKWVS